MALRIDSLSKQFVLVSMAPKVAGEPYDPTGSEVEMGFALVGQKPETFYPGSWEIDPTTTPDTFYARCLIGPGAGTTVLDQGTEYEAHVKVFDDPETPIVKAKGRIFVY